MKGGATPRVELLCIGTELLRGQLNTHQRYLALALGQANLFLARESSLPDDVNDIAEAVRGVLRRRCSVLLIAGGLGPTFDDLTRDAVASALGRSLTYRPRLYEQIKKRFVRYKIAAPE